MIKIIPLALFILVTLSARADHITGGEMTYTFNRIVNGQYEYIVVLKLYKRCNSGRLFADPNIVSVFNKVTRARIIDVSVPLDHEENIGLPPDPCITNGPTVCYEIGVYIFTVVLPPSAEGYLLASEVNYRINGITNLASSTQVGATYTCEIPGNNLVSNGPLNNSAHFTGSDLVVVCSSNQFEYSFSATDADGDQLRYSFCSAFNSQNSGTNGAPASPPPFPVLNYNAPGYTEVTPLGDQVQINPNTGLITGIAPTQGIYVVTVCVEEIRNGVVIATQRKDIQIHVADCDVASVQLMPAYYLCRNSQTITITNLSGSPLITEWNWQVYNPAGTLIYSSNNEDLFFSFSSPGIYNVMLTINPNGNCGDTDSTKVYVFPGLIPAFTFSGLCFVNPPVSFTDQTVTPPGTSIVSWQWDFGEPTTTSDNSTLQNPDYAYPTTGIKKILLTVTNSNGCIDTVSRTIILQDKPPIYLAFKDTIICKNDQIQLQASGSGLFSWSPNININNANSPIPTVFPISTTWYYVDMNDNGCRNRDSVRIRVVDRVNLQVMPDTTICRGDTIQLRIVSDGLRFSWTPFSQVYGNAFISSPYVITPTSTPYQVTSSIGGCVAIGTINVTAIPYPTADAGEDHLVCYKGSAQLQGTTDGTSWRWSPSNYLTDPNSLTPVATPAQSIQYTLLTYDNRGCPKPGKDVVTITVLPKVNLSVGNDTVVVVQQTLQLMATGADNYQWSPPANLSSPTIANPVAIFNTPTDGMTYKVVGSDVGGCKDSAYLTIKVFAGNPTIYVPTAFTPNNDGKNDYLRPIAAGMLRLEQFSIYNRWGQLVFSSNGNKGWDGRISGQLQATNTFVWIIRAIDYVGKPFVSKGTVTLIR